MRKQWIGPIVLVLIPLSTPVSAAVLIEQQSPVFELQTGEIIDESMAVFKRKSDSVEIEFNTQGLPPGVHTLWLNFFPDPPLCSESPCGLDDFFDPNVPVNQLWTAGEIVGAEGTVNFEVILEEGKPPGEVTIGRGLEPGDALNAEFQFITRWHGPPSSDPQLREAQLTTFNGGCSLEEGDGLFPCQDLQFAVFSPEVTDQSIPESSSVFGLLTLGGLGAGSLLKRLGRQHSTSQVGNDDDVNL